MRNEKLFKVLGITVLAIILLTWVIPASTYDGSAVTLGKITPVGIWDIFDDLGIAFAYFWQPGLYILLIGGLYGVVNKTGALKSLVEKTKKVFKGKEKWFLVIATALFMITSSLTGIYIPLLIFVPLFISIILSMGYSKVVALLATVGSIVIGNISLFYNSSMNQILVVDKFVNVWYNVALLVLSLILTSFYIWKTAVIAKGKNKEEIDEKRLFIEDVDKKKVKLWPIITIFSVLFVLTVVALLPWNGMFTVELFEKMFNSLITVKIGNFPIFRNILGQTIIAFGQWGITDLFALVFITTIVIALSYKLKLRNAYEGFVQGARRLLPTALLVILINIVIVFTLNSGFYTTVMNFFIGLTDKFNLVTMTFTTFIGSVLTVDNLYVSNYLISIASGIVNADTSKELLQLVTQTMYGTAMLIAPTSLILMAGLSYLEVPYTKWMKYIWRLLLLLLILVFIVLIIAMLV